MRSRWFWTWTSALSTLLITALACDFLLASLEWLPWLAAVAGVAVVGLLLGAGFGLLNPRRSSGELALVSTAASGCLFLLVLAQYAVSIAISPGCDPPDVVNHCFDDHAAAVGSMAALSGAILLMLLVWTGALGGVHLRRRLSEAHR